MKHRITFEIEFNKEQQKSFTQLLETSDRSANNLVKSLLNLTIKAKVAGGTFIRFDDIGIVKKPKQP